MSSPLYPSRHSLTVSMSPFLLAVYTTHQTGSEPPVYRESGLGRVMMLLQETWPGREGCMRTSKSGWMDLLFGAPVLDPQSIRLYTSRAPAMLSSCQPQFNRVRQQAEGTTAWLGPQ